MEDKICEVDLAALQATYIIRIGRTLIILLQVLRKLFFDILQRLRHPQ